MLESRNCPVCSDEKKDIVFTQEFNHILGISMDKFEQNIAICKQCGMVYVSPFVNDEELNKYYSYMSSYEYDNNGNIYPDTHKKRSKQQHNYIKKFNNNLSTVLDIGCSVGYTLSLFKKDGFKVLGLEPSAKNKKIAKEKYDIEVETRFLDNGGLEGRVFDIVILSHVAEHLKYPLDIFKNIRNILSENGILFIETPDIDLFDEQDLYQFFFEHINYFNLASTTNIMQQAGFELVDFKIFQNDNSTAPFYPTLGSVWKKTDKKFSIENHYINNKKTILKYINLINSFKGALNDKINDILKAHKKIAIWAAGTLTSQLLAQTSLRGGVEMIFDNDAKKDGLEMDNVRVYKPTMTSEYFKEKKIEAIVIGSWSSQDEIYKSLSFLEKNGIKIYRLFDGR